MDLTAALFADSETAYRRERLTRDARRHRRTTSSKKSGGPGLLSRTLSLSRSARPLKHPA